MASDPQNVCPKCYNPQHAYRDETQFWIKKAEKLEARIAELEDLVLLAANHRAWLPATVIEAAARIDEARRGADDE